MPRADQLFKLRLPAGLRGLLEHAAMESGRTLTGEMLERLAASFPSITGRLAEIESRMADTESSVASLLARIADLERRLGERSPPQG